MAVGEEDTELAQSCPAWGPVLSLPPPITESMAEAATGESGQSDAGMTRPQLTYPG